jgi:hypothetical protein
LSNDLESDFSGTKTVLPRKFRPDFKRYMVRLLPHSQMCSSVSGSSSAHEKRLSISHPQDSSSIDNLDADTLCVLRHRPFKTFRSIVEEVGVSAATTGGVGCNWRMPDFTLQNLQLNTLTGMNSFGFLVLPSRRIRL